ncbi:MAG: hypothetical protein ACYTGH_10820, partial [Planctomycetota bacterium]
MKKRLLLLSLCIALAAVILLTQSPNTAETGASRKHLIAQIVKNALERYHFSKKPLDDALSANAFDLYLKRIDFGKRFLLKADIDALSTHRTQIDDELNSGEMKLMGRVNALLQKRVAEVESETQPLFAQPFTFDSTESLEIDPKKRDFPVDAAARQDLWRRIIKVSILDRILAMELSLREAKEKPEDKDLQKRVKKIPTTFATQEAEAREETGKLFNALFRRLKERDSQDELRDYLNAIALAFDPHTTYMPPRDEANFNIAMSGSLQGIGAMLQETG